MCTFPTVATPHQNAAALEAALRAAHFDVFAQKNPHFAALFEAHETLLMVTRGGCSCDFVPPGPGRRVVLPGLRGPRECQADDVEAHVRARAACHRSVFARSVRSGRHGARCRVSIVRSSI